MSHSDRQRLETINKRLDELYMGLDKFGSTSTQGTGFQQEIDKLKREKSLLPTFLLTEEEIKRQSDSLRLSASFIYLQEHKLKSFAGKSDDSLTESELKSKQRATDHIDVTQLQFEDAHAQLQKLGVSDDKIEAIIQDGYQQKATDIQAELINSLKIATQLYIKRYYQDHQRLPDDVVIALTKWEKEKNPENLMPQQLKLITSKSNCLEAGFEISKIVETIRSAQRWDEQTQQDKLKSLETKVYLQSKRNKNASNLTREIYHWIDIVKKGEKINPSQHQIVSAIQDLRMYGVPEDNIKSAIQRGTRESSNGITSVLNRLFGR